MERRTAQATGVSVALHAALLATVMLIRLPAGEGPSRASIIHAELLFDAGAWSSSTNADTEKNGATAARATPAPERPEPTDIDEPATDAPVADAHDPAPAEQAPEPAPAFAEAAQETEPENFDAGAATEENLAATEPPAAETPTEPSIAPAEAAPEASAAGASTVAEAEVAPPAADDALASTGTAPAAAEAPGVPAQTRERQMIAKRFSSWNGRFTPGEDTPSVDWKQDGQAYTAVFRAPSAADPMGLEQVVVDVSTQQGGKRMSTQLTMTRLAFSNFAQFVDKWDPNVQIHDDVIDGRFHSNTPINVLSTGRTSPLFLGKVTIASHDLDTGTAGPFNRRKVFPEGVDTGVRRIVLPSRFLPFLNDAASGEDAVQRFERDARITFYADGTYGWSYVEGGAPEERRPMAAPAHYLVGLEGATLRVKGAVNGKVLVYSAQRIVIEGDLRYAAARHVADADDYLGLVAELDVEIAESKITGLGDLDVEASIYARRRFAVRDFRSSPSGTLVIYGSLTAGSITATEPRFATKIEFDPRLTNARPPSFPLTDRYELESWNGEWRFEESVVDDAGPDDSGALEDAVYEDAGLDEPLAAEAVN
jgi:hypothetical protein